ncbi:MAG: Two-component transcriptional response regulator, LuxR family, partial [uncultured Nocardioidaceae bacterium]
DPDPAGRRPGPRPRRARRAARPRDGHRGRRAGRSRGRGAGSGALLAGRGVPARHRDAGAHRPRGGRAAAGRAARRAVADRHHLRTTGLRPPRSRRRRRRVPRQGHPCTRARSRRTPGPCRTPRHRPRPRDRVADVRPVAAHGSRVGDPAARDRRIARRRDRPARQSLGRHRAQPPLSSDRQDRRHHQGRSGAAGSGERLDL